MNDPENPMLSCLGSDPKDIAKGTAGIFEVRGNALH